ncbi:polysaccharide biosynthesis tyrosine autokinase [Bifidobacterium xylocopae]|uniref:non-specific protein-tyrosine kinase n=1 Tax=Bifidobacterium xylocopae TaxID=2493119 RepID=A0A366KE79_9BIFI|nr:polysaccharide biosynthesis tyrosine autokinase [Bifidobacterium xylocopae]RBP99697.1 protein-tyrosine kinase [Bifidobacterium xylocopae]
MAIADLLRILRKHLTTAFITFAVVIAAVATVAFMMPPKYTATAELLATYTGQANTEQNTAEMSSGTSYLSTQIQTYPQLVKTESVLKPVIDDLGLTMSVKQLADLVSATNPADTFMVDITVVGPNRQESAVIANSVAESLSRQISSALYAGKGEKSSVRLSLVQRAQEPSSQSSPKVRLYLTAGAILGLVLAIVAAVLKEMLNTKVDSAEDVHEIIGGSPLGEIPQSEALKEHNLAVISEPNGFNAEAFRRIRTNLSFLATEDADQGRLLVISSVSPGEGKTTVSTNIAAALAEDEKSVLLIDADLRHPSVAHKLGIEGHVGLSHILSRQATPLDVVQKYWKTNFHILPAGKRPANASILLNSRIMTELVDQALTQYDYVIIDTAPLSVANDAIVFGRRAGGLSLVVGKTISEKKDLVETVEAMHVAKIPLLGFIFNFADAKKIHTKNYYYYNNESKQNNRKGRRIATSPK